MTGISTFIFYIANTHQTSSDTEVWTKSFPLSNVLYTFDKGNHSVHPSKYLKLVVFSFPIYHLVKIFISVYTASNNRWIVPSTVKWTTWNVYRFGPDRALGGFDPSNSDAQSYQNTVLNITAEKDQSYLDDHACDWFSLIHS